MLHYRTSKLFFLLCSTILFLASCAPQSSAPKPLLFTKENSQAIALAPFYLIKQQAWANHAWNLTLKTAENKPIAGLLKPNQLLLNTLITSYVDLDTQANNLTPPASCSGQFDAKLQAITANTWNGSVDFSNYSDDCTLSLDGSVTVSIKGSETGAVDVNISPNQLTAKTSDNSYEISGTMQANFEILESQVEQTKIVSNLILTSADNEVFHLKDFKIDQQYDQEYPQMSLNGDITFSRYGSVKLITDSPLLIQAESGLPFDGMLTFHSQDNNWVRLFFPKASYPGFFRLDGSDGLQTMGKL